MEPLTIWGVWGSFLTLWDTIKLLLPHNMGKQIAELDSRIKNFEGNIDSKVAALNQDINKIKDLMAPLCYSVDLLIKEAKKNNPDFRAPKAAELFPLSSAIPIEGKQSEILKIPMIDEEDRYFELRHRHYKNDLFYLTGLIEKLERKPNKTWKDQNELESCRALYREKHKEYANKIRQYIIDKRERNHQRFLEKIGNSKNKKS